MLGPDGVGRLACAWVAARRERARGVGRSARSRVPASASRWLAPGIAGWAAVVIVGGCGGSSAPRPAVSVHAHALALAQRTGVPVQLGCSTAVAAASPLAGVRTVMVPVAGNPFGVSSTRDGRWSFVDETRGAVAVFSDARFTPRFVRTIAVPGQAVGNSLTADGRYLLVAGGGVGGAGAAVVSVARAEAGLPGAVLGTLHGATNAGGGPIEVTSSLDGAYAFVSIEYADQVAVYNLRAALADHFARPSYVGSVRLGQAVVGMAVAPSGRWLYVTSELAAGSHSLTSPGTLSVISISRAERDPAGSVVTTVAAQCQPVRVVVSGDGRVVWVTARASDDLLAFSAARLLSDPAHALVAAVRVGEAPVGLALVDGGRWVAVADSNRFAAPGAHSALTVVDVADALSGRPAVLGTIGAGAFPREMSLEGDGTTLLVSDFASGQLEAIDLGAGTTG